MTETDKMPRPKGAPKLGTTVKVYNTREQATLGTVSGYLSTQFMIDTHRGRRVVGISEDWHET